LYFALFLLDGLMFYKKYRQNSKTVIVVSWLLTRLWSGLEISRLAILHATPKLAATRLPQTRNRMARGSWILQRNRLYFCGTSDSRGIIIAETQPLEEN
jgi:hypothetical protein